MQFTTDMHIADAKSIAFSAPTPHCPMKTENSKKFLTSPPGRPLKKDTEKTVCMRVFLQHFCPPTHIPGTALRRVHYAW